jgi:hypothetical protein
MVEFYPLGVESEDMERNATLSTVLQVLTLLVSLVGAVGVLIVDSKVDRPTGQVQALHELLVTARDDARHALRLKSTARVSERPIVDDPESHSVAV